MLLDLNKLNIGSELSFEYPLEKDDNLDKRIIELKDSVCSGTVRLNYEGEIELECSVHGIMILEDSISLEHIPYDFSFNIEENIEELENNYDECYDKLKNTLDLKRILWQNIVLEVPISYTKVCDANLKGDGWELISEENMSKEIDPRMKKLEELLERRD
jgi:uncharacterized metal-binding protein YceD (DUF177 family)